MEGIKLAYDRITSVNIDRYEPLIKEGLAAIGDKHSKDVVPYEILKEDLLRGSLYPLAILAEDGSDVGFGIFSISTDLDGKDVLHGQLGYIKASLGEAYAPSGFIAAEYIADVLQTSRIRFESARKGWAHYAALNGYAVSKVGKMYTFVKEVS